MYVVQTVVLHKEHFTRTEAISWVLRHGYKAAGGPDETTHEWRFRQTPPDKTNTFRQRMIKLGDKGWLFILYRD